MKTINEYVFGDFIGFGGMKEFDEEHIALKEWPHFEKDMKRIILEDINIRYGQQHSDEAELLKIQLNQEISYLYEQYLTEYSSGLRRSF